MRIAVLSDIHGNSFALEAVLEDIAGQSVDEIVVAGDLVNLFPNPRKTWEILKGLDGRLLQGNHEYYLYTADTPDAPEWMGSERFRPARWTAAQFSPAEKAEMMALPWHYTLPGLFIAHASERNLFDNVINSTTDEELETYFPATNAALIVRGHNHHWLERDWGGRRILSLNACGLPLNDEVDAPYTVLTRDNAGSWGYEKRCVRYDHAAALRAMDEAYITNVGPLGRIFRRELQTARGALSPFFKLYSDRMQAGEISLQAAVEAFLED